MWFAVVIFDFFQFLYLPFLNAVLYKELTKTSLQGIRGENMSSACHNLLLSSLSTYYKKQAVHRTALKDIINGNSLLSLRVIDWFVTHYARKQQVIYWIDTEKNTFYDEYPEKEIKNGSVINTNVRKFHLYMEYRAQLQSYTKLFFDPFRRHERITFILEQTPLVSIETTVGQLNFFRWAFQNHVFEYILAHLQHIEETMATYQKQLKSQQKPTTTATIDGTSNAAIDTADSKITSVSLDKKNSGSGSVIEKTKLKKKNTHIGNIVLRTPCFIRFD